jgi:hypothetical protein
MYARFAGGEMLKRVYQRYRCSIALVPRLYKGECSMSFSWAGLAGDEEDPSQNDFLQLSRNTEHQ